MEKEIRVVVKNEEVAPESAGDERNRVKGLFLQAAVACKEDKADIAKMHILRRKRYRERAFQEAVEKLKREEPRI